ncbi:MAG: alanine racemase [Bacillota bacterium]
MTVRSSLRKIRRHLTGYTPLVEVSISRENLLNNLKSYQKRYPGIGIAPVLKSNAYGHDMGTVARLLDRQKIAFFMVDSYYEARRLRRAGIRSRIVVMGYVRPEDIARNKLPHIDFAIIALEQLQELADVVTRPVRLHLKIDTGMHRQGIPIGDISYAEDLFKGEPLLELVGICSHFADADNDDDTFTRGQLEVWKSAAAELLPTFPSIEYRHLAGTKGIRFAEEAGTNVARVGIGLYGFDTAPDTETPLTPVLEIRTLITSLRELRPGASIGYNATYTADHPIRVATVPVGYYEGIDRRLSSRGAMIVNGTMCPIVGRVSMNMTSIDVTHVEDVAVGDPVIAISRTPSDPNSVSNIAHTVSSPDYRETEYVILAHIAPHLERVVE